MKRLNRYILIGSFIPFCWLAFMAVHELGHFVAAILSGGTVTKVVVHPLTISRTDVSPNPMPLTVVWAGPLAGVLVPLAAWGLFHRLKICGEFLARFFAGFCLIANGMYIGTGSFSGAGDAGGMLEHGSAFWHLWLFGIAAVIPGFLLWHNQGPKFGLGCANGQVNEWAAYSSLGLFTILYALTFAISPRF